MDKIDFVIPLCKKNMIIRTTIEGIIDNYHPKNIYVITNPSDIKHLVNESETWYKSNTIVSFINEDIFFMKIYNLTRHDINKLYTYKDENSREFGWWYQQLLKLGAYKQIDSLSDPYVVWDSDLIVLHKWEIFNSKKNSYKFAILQERAKNEFNKIEYAKSIKFLTGLDAIEPDIEGTFVPHHFIFHHKIIDSFIQYIELYNKSPLNNNWIKIIMTLSKNYNRFSEYKCITTFMNKYFPDELLFYPFSCYGKDGIRYRDSNEIIEKIQEFCNINKTDNLCYKDFVKFVKNNYHYYPSYIQIEHVVN
jgi:hypothetical protein